MIRILLALVVMLSTDAFAADWQLFDKGDSASSYIDRSSRRKEMTVYIAWLKNVHAKPQKLRQKVAGGVYVQKIELVHMNCANRTFSIKKRIYSAKDGTPLVTEDGAAGYEPVVPDSPSEVRYIAMCGKTYSKIQELNDSGVQYTPTEEPKSKWNPFTK
jgi:hypothetical protein